MAARCAQRWSRATARRRASAALGACALGLCLAAQAGPTTPAPNPAAAGKLAQSGAPGKPAQNAPAPTGAATPNGPILSRPPSVRDDGKTAMRDWIGRVVPPYPDGYRSNTGGCVGSGRSAEQICARSVGTIDDSEDRSQLLYAAELVGRAGNEARWKITDVVAYPKLQRGERVSISTCLFDGAGDPGVIAIIDTLVDNAEARETFDAVRWAVRLDRGKGKFVGIKPTEVTCYNEGPDGE
ncbi:hypothetical protein J5226_24120 [Lysobacter sp. K5869]|uniref:hypothetical protein n=1 Tax=Lysobacter sp. K5869 TaxID=2820808 RepID=UPI001C0638BD|nr:hypothetical protein [Lysobacter sp. K5869]QWP76625.1 hypothetical protein J5226_24120 [Lysobacter sp. K5869]